jgi:hypothetical protein
MSFLKSGGTLKLVLSDEIRKAVIDFNHYAWFFLPQLSSALISNKAAASLTQLIFGDAAPYISRIESRHRLENNGLYKSPVPLLQLATDSVRRNGWDWLVSDSAPSAESFYYDGSALNSVVGRDEKLTVLIRHMNNEVMRSVFLLVGDAAAGALLNIPSSLLDKLRRCDRELFWKKLYELPFPLFELRFKSTVFWADVLQEKLSQQSFMDEWLRRNRQEYELLAFDASRRIRLMATKLSMLEQQDQDLLAFYSRLGIRFKITKIMLGDLFSITALREAYDKEQSARPSGRMQSPPACLDDVLEKSQSLVAHHTIFWVLVRSVLEEGWPVRYAVAIALDRFKCMFRDGWADDEELVYEQDLMVFSGVVGCSEQDLGATKTLFRCRECSALELVEPDKHSAVYFSCSRHLSAKAKEKVRARVLKRRSQTLLMAQADHAGL